MKIRKATRPLSFYLFTFFIHLWLLPITYKLPAEALYVYFLVNSDHRLDDAYATVTCYTQWRNGMGNWESVQFLPEVKFHDEFAIFFFGIGIKDQVPYCLFFKNGKSLATFKEIWWILNETRIHRLCIVENLTLSIYANCHYCTYVIEFISLILLF